MTTNEKSNSKIVVIGSTGLIGSKVVTNLRERGKHFRSTNHPIIQSYEPVKIGAGVTLMNYFSSRFQDRLPKNGAVPSASRRRSRA